MRASVFALILVGAVACSSSDESPRDPQFVDAAVPDTGVEAPALTFMSTVVDGLGDRGLFGDNAVLQIAPNGRPAVAYGYVPFGTTNRLVRYAVRNPDGTTWTIEDAAEPGAAAEIGGELVGLGFGFVGGIPHIVYLGGPPANANILYPNDLVLSTRNGGVWSEQSDPLVAESGEAVASCPGLQNLCNTGVVVGTHAALAVSSDGNGYMVAYQDLHNGFGTDSFAKSDVEVFGSGVAPAASVVDITRGGGEFLGIALTDDDRPVVAYNIISVEDEAGVWAAVWRDAAEGWVLSKLSDDQTSARTSVAAASDGTLYVAFFDTGLQKLVLATSTDDGDSWSTEQVETSGSVGLHPSLVVDDQDRPVIAYTYCGRFSADGCPGNLGNDSEVRLARRIAGEWEISLVDDGVGRGFVGLFNSLAIAPDGTIYVAFQDARENDLIVAEAQP